MTISRKARARSIVALVVVLGATASAAMASTSRRSVEVTPVVRGGAVDAVYATGTVQPQPRVEVRARIAGTVTAITAQEGERVKSGAGLAVIGAPPRAMELRGARARLAAALAKANGDGPALANLRAESESVRARLAAAKVDLARAEALVRAGATRPADAERLRTEVTALEEELAASVARERDAALDLRANAQAQTAAVDALASEVDDGVARAPADGEVLMRHVELGDFVQVGAPLFTIGDTTRLEIDLHVDEADVTRVSPGARADVRFYAFPGRVFRGDVARVRPDADAERKAYLVRVRLRAAPRGLMSGMSAEANVVVDERSGALLVPAEALAGGHVWVVENGRAHRRAVETGLRDLLRVEVTRGLSEGDAVVRGDTEGLREGARVDARVVSP